jgi:hypothetical protein
MGFMSLADAENKRSDQRAGGQHSGETKNALGH